MGFWYNAKYRKLLIFSLWPVQKKKVFFYYIIDIHDKLVPPGPPNPTRPGPAMTLLTDHFSFSSKDTNLTVQKNLVICVKNVVSNFEQKIFICLEVKAFLVKPDICLFHTFSRVFQESLNIFKIWILNMKEHHKTYQNLCGFYWKNKFCKV